MWVVRACSDPHGQWVCTVPGTGQDGCASAIYYQSVENFADHVAMWHSAKAAPYEQL